MAYTQTDLTGLSTGSWAESDVGGEMQNNRPILKRGWAIYIITKMDKFAHHLHFRKTKVLLVSGSEAPITPLSTLYPTGAAQIPIRGWHYALHMSPPPLL